MTTPTLAEELAAILLQDVYSDSRHVHAAVGRQLAFLRAYCARPDVIERAAMAYWQDGISLTDHPDWQDEKMDARVAMFVKCHVRAALASLTKGDIDG